MDLVEAQELMHPVGLAEHQGRQVQRGRGERQALVGLQGQME